MDAQTNPPAGSLAVTGLGDAERARLAALVEALDLRVASRPDIIASPAGFILGALIGACRTDPDDAWGQFSGFADVLVYLVGWVKGQSDVELEPLLDAFIPAGPPA